MLSFGQKCQKISLELKQSFKEMDEGIVLSLLFLLQMFLYTAGKDMNQSRDQSSEDENDLLVLQSSLLIIDPWCIMDEADR